MKIKASLIITMISASVFISCQEDQITESGTLSSEDYLFAENIFNDVGRIVEDAFINNGEAKSCPDYIVMNADSTNKDTIIVDFGNGNPDNCLSYGNERKGKIIIIYTGKYKDSLSVIHTTFDNYYVNNNRIQGERVLTNKGRNEDGNFTFSIDIIDASIKRNGTINWESNQNIEYLEGYNTFINPFDDKYIIDGSGSGNSINGQDFIFTITNNLYIDLSCLSNNTCVITSGEVKLTPAGYSERYINYGDNLCDCNISITLNGEEHFVVIN